MNKRIQMRNIVLKIILIMGLAVGVYLSFQQSFPAILNSASKTVQNTYIWTSIIAMFAGFINIYYTTKRDVKFIYPDLINLIMTIVALFLAQTYSMIPLSFWGIIVGFIQYFDWKSNVTETGETKLLRVDKTAIYIMLAGAVVAFLIVGILMIIGHEGQGLITGAFTTGTGLIASFLLAKRYFIAEYIFFALNVLMLSTYLISGQFMLMIVPLVYFANNIVFLFFNRVSDYD
ncbi:nicotinamide mononucleotide transporter [Weissella kandleri]|nr:nicotinamide mononucleotide transporter [Weissella kandleri]